MKLSPHQDEVLAVKVEVDTNPPAGATLTTSLVRRHVLLNLQHHDRASLLAGKLHAVLHLFGFGLSELEWGDEFVSKRLVNRFFVGAPKCWDGIR